MKKCYYNYLAVVTCIFMSCSDAKEEVVPSDTTPPVITMLGKNPDSVIVKTVTSYNDPGATAVDDKDGDITSKIVYTPQPYDFTATGSFIIYYNVEDNAHNVAEKLKRTVFVVTAAATYNASYACSGVPSGTVNLTSNNANDTITILNVFSSGTNIKAALSGTSYNIYQQTLITGTEITGTINASGTTLNVNFSTTGII